jgi:hypothetical protein
MSSIPSTTKKKKKRIHTKFLNRTLKIILIQEEQLGLFGTKINTRDWWSGSSGRVSGLANMRPWVQTPVLEKQKLTLGLEM